MTNALAFQLGRLEWGGFVTLTFGASWSKRKTARKVERVLAWVRAIYSHHLGRRDIRNLAWVAAEEVGEMGCRYHVHLLLGDLPRRLSRNDCFAMQWLWREGFRGGFAKIRPYSPSLQGVGYILKGISLKELRAVSSESARDRAETLAGAQVGRTTTFQGANAFEVGKIGQLSEGLTVMVSPRCYALLAGRANPVNRRLQRSQRFFKASRMGQTPCTLSKRAAGESSDSSERRETGRGCAVLSGGRLHLRRQ